MMNVKWHPEIEGKDEVIEVLNRCDSKLEVMCILGIAYYFYDKLREKVYSEPDYEIVLSKKSFQGKEGICFSSIYMKRYNTYYGPFELIAIPQYRSQEKKIRHDLGFFLSIPDVRMRYSSIEIFSCAVEIDGYHFHHRTRERDEKRIANLSYPVIRVFEEQTESTQWFDQYVKEFSTLLHAQLIWDSLPQWRGRELECPQCGERIYELDFLCENCRYEL